MKSNTPFFISFILCFSFWACKSSVSPNFSEEKPKISYQQAVANYLGLPDFVHDSFAKVAIPPFARLEKYHPSDQMLYFSTPMADFEVEMMLELVQDTAKVEYGKSMGNGYVRLGPAYLYNKDRYLFRFPVEELRVDSSLVWEKHYTSAVYQLPISGLRAFLEASNLYNSPALFISDTTDGNLQYIVANHSAPIAPKGESSLEVLVSQLVLPTDLPEIQAQKLLDFVTTQIEYQYHNYEIFMKPHEVLLSGKTDCSGKVVLYSSLLHQIGIPHLLIYQDEHICVALEGDFPHDNNMNFLHEGIPYQIAETTVPGFEIGKTFLQSPIVSESFQYIQRPGFKTKLFDVNTGDSLDFAVRYVPISK